MRRLVPFVVLATLFAILSPNVAIAHTVSYETNIDARRDPGGVVEPGTRVRIFGELSSPVVLSSQARRCRIDSLVRLVRVGGGEVDTDRTNRAGDFSFGRVRVTNTTRFRVVFDGKILNAVHPHTHSCDRSSDGVRVRVG